MTRHRFRRSSSDESHELNIVPYLDILMNLILFILLSISGLATFGAVNVTAHWPGSVGGTDSVQALAVGITGDGFVIDAPSGRSLIPRVGGALNFQALNESAQRLKGGLGSKAVVTAAGDTDYQPRRDARCAQTEP